MNDSSLSRVVGVLFSPTRTFEAIRERPTWLVTLGVLVVLGMLLGHFVSQRLDVEEVVRASIADSGRQLSDDQVEQAIALQERVLPVVSVGGPAVFWPVGCLIVALLFWVLLKMLGGELPYKASLATAVHGLVPSGVSALLTLPVVLSRGDLSYEEVRSSGILASNAAAFAPEETAPALLALLSSLDVFTIWSVILLSIGYSVVAGVSRGKAAAVVIGLWIAFILFKVGAASVFG